MVHATNAFVSPVHFPPNPWQLCIFGSPGSGGACAPPTGWSSARLWAGSLFGRWADHMGPGSLGAGRDRRRGPGSGAPWRPGGTPMTERDEDTSGPHRLPCGQPCA